MGKKEALLLINIIAGCQPNYELYNHVSEQDTGIYDTGNIETNLSFDSCDPYDAGWDVVPEGTGYPLCVGVEDVILQFKENSQENTLQGFSTQLYLADCSALGNDFPSLYITQEIYSEDNELIYNGAGGAGLGSFGECGNYHSNGFSQLDIYPFSPETQYLSLYSLWIGTDEELDGHITSSELEQLPEPLHGVIDCLDAREVEECVVTLYH